jgi:Tfp pilus assembly protein PilE
MQRAFGGYTLIEVMIFLAVSSVLLAVTVVAIRGQQAHTEFTSGVNDLNTKMQQWIDQVANGLSGSTADINTSDYNCVVPNPSDNNSLPQLDKVAAGSGTARGANPQCVFLGKAVEFLHTMTDGSASPYDGTIEAYTVIGRRTYTPSGGIETTVDSLVHAKPVAAVFPDVSLTEEYRIPDGVKVLSVKSKASAAAPYSPSHMAGFFTSFSNESSSNGSMSVIGVQYPLTTAFLPGAPGPLNCIKLDSSSPCNGASAPSNLWPMYDWEICLQSSRSDDRALLTLNSGSGGLGVATKLKLDSACT